MAKKFLVDLNLNQNELQNAAIQNLASAPANPVVGQVYFNTTSKALNIWNGEEWVNSTFFYTFSTGLTETDGVVTLNKATTEALGGVIVSTNINVDSDGKISVNTASDSQLGVIEIADATEVAAGTATDKAITPKQLKDGLDTKLAPTDLSATSPITYNSSTKVIAAEFDSAPTADSTKFVNSGVVKTALDDKVTKNADITGATKCKVTYDAKGLVTAGADLEASDIPDISATYVKQEQLGVASVAGGATGVATLGTDGLVPSSQLPSYVDDVIDAYTNGDPAASGGKLYSDSACTTEITPDTGKIYVVVGHKEGSTSYDGRVYRWSGSAYVCISNPWGQATETELGVAKIATSALVTAGTDDTTIVTPLKLEGRVDAYASETVTLTNKSIDADNNTLSNIETDNFKSGVVQTSVRAVASASDTALASEKAISTELAKKPEKLIVSNPVLASTSGKCTWTITNTLGSDDVLVTIKEASTGEEVMCDVVYGTGTITVTLNSSSNVEASVYKAVVIG